MNRRAFLKMLVFAPIAGLLAKAKMPEVDSKTATYLRYRELMDKLIDKQKGEAKAVTAVAYYRNDRLDALPYALRGEWKHDLDNDARIDLQEWIAKCYLERRDATET